MSDSSRKQKKTSPINREQRAALTALGEAMLLLFKEKEQELSDHFDRYAYSLRSKVHFETKDFCKRFVRGYEVILKKIQEK